MWCSSGVHTWSTAFPFLYKLSNQDRWKYSKPVLLADDTSLIATHSNLTHFNKEITFLFIQLNEQFAVNLLSLNFKKNLIYMQSMTETLLWMKHPLATLTCLFQTLRTQTFLE